jgi:hypothetical protein
MQIDMLQSCISNGLASESDDICKCLQDLDDWPREHERAGDVEKALAALEPALYTSVAIDPDKLVNLTIRLLPARYMFFIQVALGCIGRSSIGPPVALLA